MNATKPTDDLSRFAKGSNVAQACAHMSVGLAGHFTMTVSGGKRGTVVLADFDNMILDSGLNFLAGTLGSNTVGYCQVGTGTTAVSASQTALANQIANTASLQRAFGAGTYVAGPPAYKTDYQTYRFGTGVAAGNLTEVGVGWAPTGSLFSRALIVDGGGAPTTITVLSDETLDVTYTLRCYAPSDVTGSVTLAGTSYSYTIRGANMAAGGTGSWNPGDVVRYGFANASLTSVDVYSGTIDATPGGIPTGTNAFGSAVCTPAAYVTGSYQRAVEIRCDLNDCNISGGFKSYYVRCTGSGGQPTHAFQVQFSPNVPKDNTKVLRLNMVFSVARAP
jgi:hypothetical protein